MFGEQTVPVYTLGNTTLGADILAFCIQPTVTQGPDTVYTQHSGVVLADLFPADVGIDRAARIHSLFEQNYASLSTGTDLQKIQKRVSFQIALWDLVADDGSLTNTHGLQYVNGASYAQVEYDGDLVDLDLSMAQGMLTNSETVVSTNSYAYTKFTGVSGGHESQMLLSVSAVPEADTWAMMVVGLGLVGFMGRRRQSDESEKFAV
ncbi:PEP-CTERM sorting domain-containing protein [Pseudoduganella sp. FT55W]|uniref:PEP-CTERM sorting domain-containing protein n=2 Tax=Duganella rivi TaxID=2666083 RepID=A0A7X4KCP8_9BURK|nr:PEP-CTERM sorting domain-containing protein [Duganella rivi]